MDRTKDAKCPICEGDAQTAIKTIGDWHEFDCPACGTFRITDTAFQMAPSRTMEQRRGALATAIRRRTTINTIPMIGGEDFR